MEKHPITGRMSAVINSLNQQNTFNAYKTVLQNLPTWLVSAPDIRLYEAETSLQPVPIRSEKTKITSVCLVKFC